MIKIFSIFQMENFNDQHVQDEPHRCTYSKAMIVLKLFQFFSSLLLRGMAVFSLI